MTERSGESVARALLAGTDGIGPRSFQSLLDEIDSALELFEHPDRLDTLDVRGIGDTRRQQLLDVLDRWDPEAAAGRLAERDIGVLSGADDAYPSLLESIYDPPPVLFYRGSLSPLESTCVAVVGTRSASPGGRQTASRLAAGLAGFGVTVVSGLAAGIDGAAHRGALERGENTTVAVLGNGLETVYPHRHRELQSRIAREGLLLTEYPPDAGPKREHFPARNRIISGLSRAVIVVQAGARSGAIITADLALEQGREVYAVPGAVDDERHTGCHRLIKEGAGLVESPEDVIDFLQLEGVYRPPGREVSLDEPARTLFALIKQRPVHLDELVEESGSTIGDCARRLMALEREGLIHTLPGQRYQRSRDAAHVEVVPPEGT